MATLGPASSTRAVLRGMICAGVDVARLNFSHGTHKEHLSRIELIREINKKRKRRVKLLGDLEGFRIRVGRFLGRTEKTLKKNSTVRFAQGKDDGDDLTIPFDYAGDLKKIAPGSMIYIDDGNLILKVTGSRGKELVAKVIEGGALKERKGINMPTVDIPFSGITEKDKLDIAFAARHKMDYLAQSFVRSAEDIETVRGLAVSSRARCGIIAKIESRQAIADIDRIIDAADGIMVARGDMGIAVPIYEIAVIQKLIIKKCNRKKKMVITATQMLEHMTEHPRPTRAEVTDVANAILDGTDCVMLSGESAAGKYPVETVRMMDKIIKYTETYEKLAAKKSIDKIPLSL